MLEQAARQHAQAAEEEKAELAASRRQLEQRYTALEQAEESLRRRIAEIDQLEVQIRHELEQRERQLALDEQELEKARTVLRQQLQRRGKPAAEAADGAVRSSQTSCRGPHAEAVRTSLSR
jgi:hypothetical protein